MSSRHPAVSVTHGHKLMYPADGIVKRQVVDYYRRVAGAMLRHLGDRPLMLQRLPDGLGQEEFYQKQASRHFPSWIKTVSLIKRDAEEIRQVYCQNPECLTYLANQGVLAFHAWTSRVQHLENPDRLIFDLDPPVPNWAELCWAARSLRELLERVGLGSWVMTTGSRGLHVVVGLKPRDGFDLVRCFARRLARFLAFRHPERLTVAQRRKRRDGRVYLDVMRNAYGQTAIGPYSLRALPGAPVATPLAWAELDRADMGPRRYHLRNVLRRLGQKDDPWLGLLEQAQDLAEPWRRLEALEQEVGMAEEPDPRRELA